jgi:hypothetical protein
VNALVMSFIFAALPDGLIAEMDSAWLARTPGNHAATAQKVVAKLKPHAGEFDAAWRLARAYCWISERQPYFKDGAYKVRIGKLAIKHANKAIALQPKRVEGHYYHAWAVGQWSLGVSIPTALWQGAEGKLRKSMAAAERIDRSFDNFGVLRMWGRLFHGLPWPKHDGAKALKNLSEGVKRTPHNIRGYFYLVESQIEEDQNAQACKTASAGLAAKASTSAEPDWKVWKRDLRKLKAGGCKKLLEDL